MTSTAPAWTIRDYQPGDEPALVALFARVFGRPMSEAQWRWKYLGQPAPVSMVWVAEAQGRIIGHYGAFPLRARIDGRERLAASAGDAMVEPEFRGAGVLTALVEHGHTVLGRAGCVYVMGLPTQHWGARARGPNWQALFPLRWLVRPLRPEALAARRMRLPGLARLSILRPVWNGLFDLGLRRDPALQVRPMTDAGPEFDQLWQTVRAEVPVGVCRDSAWIKWRYRAAPHVDYRVLLAERDGAPAGYAVYRLDRSPGRLACLVVEWFAPGDASAYETLIATLIRDMQAAGAEQVITLAIPGTPAYQRLRRAGFLSLARGEFTVRLVPLDASLSMDRLRQPLNWDLAAGDFDVA